MPTISGFSKAIGHAFVPGGPIGEIRVPGDIGPGDTLLAVEQITDASPPTRIDLTSEFAISGSKAGLIANTTTVTTGKFLSVLWARAE